MPNQNHIANADRPLVRDPRHEDAAAGTSEQRAAEAKSLSEMHTNLARQADKLDSEAGKRAESEGLVTREELNEILRQHQDQMQSLMSVFDMLQRNDPRRATPVTENTLVQERIAYDATIKALNDAHRESVYIVPLQYEAQAMEQNSGQPLYRMIVLNGVGYPVPVGAVAEVPAPIAEIIHHAEEGRLGKWRKQVQGLPLLRNESQPAQDLEQIPRPQRIQGADEFGRSGLVGTDVFRPFNNESPRRLDAR